MSTADQIGGDSFVLFVYGTLKRGGARHPALAKQTFLGEGQTLPLYALVDLTYYPGLVRLEKEGRGVRGELYRVETRLIDKLDQFEGAPTLFRLEPVSVEGRDEPVYAYLYQRSTQGRAVCASDCWVNA